MDTRLLKKLIAHALREDVGSGDITSEATLAASICGTAYIIAKENAVMCGLCLVPYLFPCSHFLVHTRFKEGSVVKKGARILSISGPLKNILERERVFLNFLGRLSGIATLTYRYKRACHNKKIKIMDTRKTTPNLRFLEKYAVRVGGGTNHRFGLYDEILIKDNHMDAIGSLSQAIRLVQRKYPHKKIEVEARNLKHVQEALGAAASVIMLDNMDKKMIRKACDLIQKRALIEVSGNMTLKKVQSLSKLPIDRISVGALTHSAPHIDFSMRVL
ncbi:MAG: carboxylating nicotinate-nucleotide diphosphorylase [Deltaproteobacteria bacterium]|nr:carboxylating nicotinate-nucleotide diphosphorylase [Deltaproteobacteria bacterium]